LAHVDIRAMRVWGASRIAEQILSFAWLSASLSGPLAARWEPNAPEAVLMSTDGDLFALALEPHPDDADRRCVVLIWPGTKLARMSTANDEARSGHRLWSRRLASILWAAGVEDSELVVELEMGNRVHPRHDPAMFHRLSHYVLPLKECTVEVVASDAQLLRDDGPPLIAAGRALVPQT
jgi:hypothetical protein